jgi:hypothetical protein
MAPPQEFFDYSMFGGGPSKGSTDSFDYSVLGGPKTTTPTQSPLEARRAKIKAKDASLRGTEPVYRAAVGAAKQVGETATGLVQMVPGGQTALDAIYKHVFGLKDPATARKVGLERTGTAEKVGGTAASIAEFAVPERAAAGIVGKLPAMGRAATTAVKTGLTFAGGTGVAKAQGDPNAKTAGAMTAVSPALEVAAPAASAAAKWLRGSASEKLSTFFGNSALEPKHVRKAAELIVPTALDEGIPKSWKAWAAQTETAKDVKGAAVGTTKAGPAGDMWAPVQPVIDALEDLKQKAAVVMMPVSSGKGPAVPTAVMTKNDALLRAINTFQSKLKMLPTNNGSVPARILHDIKESWNELVYAKKASVDMNVRDLALNAKKRAAKTAVGAIRDILQTESPKLSDVDQAYHIATQLHRAVLDAALEATGKVEAQVAHGVAGAMKRFAGSAGGAGTGAALGGSYGYQHGGVLTGAKDAAIGAIVGGVSGRMLQNAFQSPGWKLMDVRTKNALAEAIVGGKIDTVRKIVAPLLAAGVAGQPEQKSAPTVKSSTKPQAKNEHLDNALHALRRAETIGADKNQQTISDAGANATRAEMPIGPEGVQFLSKGATAAMDRMAKSAGPIFEQMQKSGVFRGERTVNSTMKALAGLPQALPQLTKAATLALKREGFLGFENAAAALKAIRDNPNWSELWEVRTHVRDIVDKWRAAALLTDPPPESIWEGLKSQIAALESKSAAGEEVVGKGIRGVQVPTRSRSLELMQKFGGKGPE